MRRTWCKESLGEGWRFHAWVSVACPFAGPGGTSPRNCSASVEPARAVVEEWPLEGDLGGMGVGDFFRCGGAGGGGFAPNHGGKRRISQAAGIRPINPAAELVEAFRCALAVNKFTVARVSVGKQEPRGIRIRA